ncbi:hypothetical protein BS639_14665 [Rouxiella silvae]|uniref:Uncharacterized protein n=1 Tax=Rouxiella silvae TaxID=1646373 RepID=A0AA40WXY3_9GAMM|nr:hypothetical protein [Rouxiella silvae]KQN47318.1 hypothetical protein ASE93_08340 [Serratia sp. Leaf50]MBF6635107.1 hypothetical protein [Rouxiella silvae]ORJ20552.1 hypothetical protein BS639_14665 [Rouxiella silvae]
MAKNIKKSSKSVSHLAAKILNDPKASVIEKSLAGSVLSQSGTENQTGENLQTIASAALKNPRSSEVTQTLAGSVVSQSTKDR